MKKIRVNCMVKFGTLLEENTEIEVIVDIEQQITLKQSLLEKICYTIVIYAKYIEMERLRLWDGIYHPPSSMDLRWLVEDDFNVIMNKEGMGVYQFYLMSMKILSFA